MDERVRLRTIKILERRAQYLEKIQSIKRRTKNKIARQKRQTQKIRHMLNKN
jgi:hypothetical protein